MFKGWKTKKTYRNRLIYGYKINFLGDIGLFRRYEKLNIDPFSGIQLPQADYSIGNFEFIVSKNRNKNFYDVQEKYSCSFSYAEKLNLNVFSGFSLANNHCLDYGLNGALDTIDLLQRKKFPASVFQPATVTTLVFLAPVKAGLR
ncbi:MAG: hypothetical protein HC906_18815 [Bacteroidales bacterium]|nr:hypothetical protein [Bacteroidales bacterium]